MFFSSSALAEKIIATGDVYVRTSPPNGLFCSRGDPLGVIEKGDSVKLLEEVRAVCGLFFSYKFFMIEYTDNKGNTHRAYVSQVDSDGTELFKRGE